MCDDAVRKENQKNYEFENNQSELQILEESIKAKHLDKDVKVTQTGNRLLYLRSKMNPISNRRMLLYLYIFGLQTIHGNSRHVLSEFQKQFGNMEKENVQIDNSKLYGLYRCRGDNIIYKDDQVETAAYMACAYGGI